MDVTLRTMTTADLDQVFGWEQHPDAIAMAAFTRADPADRAAFDAHYRRILTNPTVLHRAVDADGTLAGTIASFPIDTDREVTYWIDPSRWGQGIASAALAALLHLDPTRPLTARVAEHNAASARVLTRAGFVRIGTDVGYADGVQRDVTEHIYRLAG